MKSLFTMAVTILAVLLLSSGGLLVTHAATPSSSQALTLNMTGGVVSAGDQKYVVQQYGPALYAMIAGDQLVSSQLTYTLNAYQNGITTHGSASFQLSGQDVSGNTVTVSGTLSVVGSVAAVCLPSGNVSANLPVNIHQPNCAALGTSEVPYYFLAGGQVQISINGVANTLPEAMALESAYFNPFGAPITLTSIDNSIVIVTTYTVATIDWSNVVDAGLLAGALGTTPITGAFQQVATEHEDLVAGTAVDSGTLTLSGVTDSSGNAIKYMDGTGTYSGNSIIPLAGAFPCGPTCTETGFQDTGSFQISGGHGMNTALITGSYATTWTVPAFGFTSIATGSVTQTA